MLIKSIDIDNIWKFPFGTQVFIKQNQLDKADPDLSEGWFTYTARDQELGELFVDTYGELFWSSGELSGDTVKIETQETEDLVKMFVKGLTAYTISLHEEPIMHAETIAYNAVTTKNMLALQELFENDINPD